MHARRAHPLAFDTQPIREAIETVTFPGLGPKVVDALRDLAIHTEGRSLDLAHELMLLAQFGRPHGPLIREKIAEYEARMKGDDR